MNNQIFKKLIIYEDNHLLVVNKPSTVAVQNDGSSKTTIHDQAKEYLKVVYNKPGNVYLAIVHRLDQSVSGVLIFAKTSKAAKRLNDQFREKSLNYYENKNSLMNKKYLVLVDGCVEDKERELVNNLIKRNHRAFVVSAKDKSKEARLFFKTIKKSREISLLEVNLITGYYHQIRCQLAHINHPIAGDSKYSSEIKSQRGQIFLHCIEMTIFHPISKESLRLKASVPEIWKNYSNLITPSYMS